MTPQELKKLLKCPLDRDLKVHVEMLNDAISVQNREELCDALARLDGYMPKGKMDDGRNKQASLIHHNPEWREFVLDTMDNIRNQALLDGDSEFLRGQLVALNRAYRHFEACFNRTTKPQDNGE